MARREARQGDMHCLVRGRQMFRWGCLQVLGLRRGSSEDPRRLLKEVVSLVVSVSSAGGLYAWHAAQAYCVNSLRYFRK